MMMARVASTQRCCSAVFERRSRTRLRPGLSIVRDLVELYGGRSNLHRLGGLRVTLKLPA
jgi:signal transduction histidine kinase